MNDHPNDAKEKLENLQFPQIDMSEHKKQLKAVLLACGRSQTRETGGFNSAAPLKLVEVIMLKKKALAVVIPSILLLAVLSFYIIFSPPQAVAALTLQVNPAITLALDDDNTIIEFEGKNAEGQEIIAISNLQGKKLGEALEEITALMYDRGFLLPESSVAMTVHAVNNSDAENLSAISDFAQQAMMENLRRFNIHAQVECFVLSKELYAYLAELGLMPMDYADLLKANLSEEEIREVIAALEKTYADTGAGAIPYIEFDLRIESDERELLAEFEQKRQAAVARVRIRQDGKDNIRLRDSAALDYLIPIFGKLDINASMSRKQVVDRVLAAFGWDEPYEELEIEVKFADGSSIDFEWEGEPADTDYAGPLPYNKFNLEIESDEREHSVKFEQKQGGSYAAVKIGQDGQKDIQLKGSAALDYLIPIFEKLDINASMSREQIVDRVLAAFGWDEPYEEFEIKVKFADGSSIDFEWEGEPADTDYDDDEDDEDKDDDDEDEDEDEDKDDDDDAEDDDDDKDDDKDDDDDDK